MFGANIHKHYQKKRIVVICFSVALLLMLYFFENASFTLRAISAISFFVFFYILDHSFDLRFHKKHYLFVIIISIASFLLSPLYFTYPSYDKIQHLIQPVMISSIVFYMISKIPMPRKWLITYTFFVVIGMLALFEIGEYGLDNLFDLKLQGVYLRDAYGFDKFDILLDKNDDTMIDLILGIVGTGLYCIIKLFRSKKSLLYKYH